MNRRQFTLATPVSMAQGAYPAIGRLIAWEGTANTGMLAGSALRVFGMRLPMQAAIKAGLMPVGTVLFLTPQTARAEPFSFFFGMAIAMIVREVINRNSNRDQQLADTTNWQGAPEAGTSVHARTGASEILKPQARFVDQQRGLIADMSRGKLVMGNSANTSLPAADRDLNSTEAPALAGLPYVFPLTPRLEPVGDARKKLEEAYRLMGGSFGNKDGAYARMLSDAAGEHVVGITNGTVNGQSVIAITPPVPRIR